HHGGDRVGGVVETIDVGEQQRDHHHRDDHAHAALPTGTRSLQGDIGGTSRSGLRSVTATPSGVFQHDRIDDVADVAALVDGLLDQLEQVLGQHRAHRVVALDVQGAV